jgi:hypothetical protein
LLILSLVAFCSPLLKIGDFVERTYLPLLPFPFSTIDAKG